MSIITKNILFSFKNKNWRTKVTCKTHYYAEVDKTYHRVYTSCCCRSMGSFIDGFQDREIRVSIKISLIHVVVVIRVQKNTWSKTLYYLLLILNKNFYAFKSGSFCFGLLYRSKSIWPVIYRYWYSELAVASV